MIPYMSFFNTESLNARATHSDILGNANTVLIALCQAKGHCRVLLNVALYHCTVLLHGDVTCVQWSIDLI